MVSDMTRVAVTCFDNLDALQHKLEAGGQYGYLYDFYCRADREPTTHLAMFVVCEKAVDRITFIVQLLETKTIVGLGVVQYVVDKECRFDYETDLCLLRGFNPAVLRLPEHLVGALARFTTQADMLLTLSQDLIRAHRDGQRVPPRRVRPILGVIEGGKEEDTP